MTDAPTGPDRDAWLDIPALNAFLARSTDRMGPAISAALLKGGNSNPTFKVEADTGTYVLRKRPARAGVYGHSVEREFRVMSALADSGVPVPRTIVSCEDESVLGGRFYLMDFVQGRVSDDCTLPGFAPEERREIYRDFVSAIAHLHSVDPRAVGLEDYGKWDSGYLQRQMLRLGQAFAQEEPEDLDDMFWLIEHLPPMLPAQVETRIVHGDVRIGNTIIHATEPRIAGLIDWELSTLGDPTVDAALLPMPHNVWPTPINSFAGLDLEAWGIPDEETMVGWYVRAASRPMDHYPVLACFNVFRSAAIYHGVQYRARHGTRVSDQAEGFGAAVRPLAARARRMAEALRS
ncbi:phosphotransferase family protein [Brevundimonas staleyi]|uniref:Phosphotransferase family protein n=1 Tax=Brevundimonas staleyi TaxID=74326 RepID=A0ABW0FNB8_9CAUL